MTSSQQQQQSEDETLEFLRKSQYINIEGCPAEMLEKIVRYVHRVGYAQGSRHFAQEVSGHLN